MKSRLVSFFNVKNFRGTTIGIFLLLVTNILYVSNNYIVKLAQLSAGETALVRGFIQFVVFGTLIIIKKRKFVSDDAVTESQESNDSKFN